MERDEYEDEMREIVWGMHGLHVGLLTEQELAAFDYLCKKGLAARQYSGAAGLLGVAKVNLHPASPTP